MNVYPPPRFEIGSIVIVREAWGVFQTGERVAVREYSPSRLDCRVVSFDSEHQGWIPAARLDPPLFAALGVTHA